MKTLLLFTAITEGLTGLALIIVPSLLSEMLLGQPLYPASAFIMAMVAGAALLSLSVGCWFLREQESASGMVKALLSYNILVVFIFVYSITALALKSIPFGLVACAHTGCAVWCGIVLKNKGRSL